MGSNPIEKCMQNFFFWWVCNNSPIHRLYSLVYQTIQWLHCYSECTAHGWAITSAFGWEIWKIVFGGGQPSIRDMPTLVRIIGNAPPNTCKPFRLQCPRQMHIQYTDRIQPQYLCIALNMPSDLNVYRLPIPRETTKKKNNPANQLAAYLCAHQAENRNKNHHQIK